MLPRAATTGYSASARRFAASTSILRPVMKRRVGPGLHHPQQARRDALHARPRAAAREPGRASSCRWAVASASSRGAGERVEDLLGRVPVAALLEPDVVVDAHAGEQRELLAPKAGDPAAPKSGSPTSSGRTSARRARRNSPRRLGVAHGFEC